MSAAQVFALANPLALAGWVLLVAAPRRRWTATMSGLVIPGLFAAAYMAIIATKWHEGSGGFSSLAEVAALFSNPWLLLAGWLHYLAFDLLIGAWEVRDAHERGLPHIAVVPCLLLTFLFGPLGWLCYLVLRGVWTRRASA